LCGDDRREGGLDVAQSRRQTLSIGDKVIDSDGAQTTGGVREDAIQADLLSNIHSDSAQCS
jgi:hypothetical protein